MFDLFLSRYEEQLSIVQKQMVKQNRTLFIATITVIVLSLVAIMTSPFLINCSKVFAGLLILVAFSLIPVAGIMAKKFDKRIGELKNSQYVYEMIERVRILLIDLDSNYETCINWLIDGCKQEIASYQAKVDSSNTILTWILSVTSALLGAVIGNSSIHILEGVAYICFFAIIALCAFSLFRKIFFLDLSGRNAMIVRMCKDLEYIRAKFEIMQTHSCPNKQ